ncbi:uncharacterized protein LOC105844444 [Hydra vulgaris]|uniref:uncharacterized protein LOC105844444 n=1 Tax=Hydra vulgaris TaxID=6087 RepID=UPI001F5F4CF8|nr:uncharacterized protein LOC105844444 [Hydra vulgaris]
MIFFHIAISLSLFASVKSASIDVSAGKNNLKEGDNVTITTQITLLPNDQITVIKWLYNSSIDLAVALTVSSFALYSNSRILFGDRISAVYDSSTGYIINLNNLRANDSMTLTVKLTYQNGDTFGVVNKSLTIDVKADPVILSFPDTIFVNDGNTLFVESILYGRPKPNSNIVNGDQTFSAYNFIDFSNNIYKYFYNLSTFYANSCGSVLLLNVFGNGIAITRSATVFVQFTPGIVSLSSPVVQLENFSIYLNWNSIPSGTCPVTYNIEFLNNTYQIVNQFYGINTTSVSIANEANATFFKIYAVYNGTPGQVLIQPIPPPQSTVTTITTATAVKATIPCSKPEGDFIFKKENVLTTKVSTIVGISVGVGIIFVGLLVASYCLGYYRHKKLTNKNKKEMNDNNGLTSYQELAHLSKGNIDYQKLNAGNKVIENNKSFSNIDYQNVTVSEPNYNYVDPKFS